MKFVTSSIFTLLFCITLTAQKHKSRSLLDVVSCKTENCITQFMDDYGFTFTKKETLGNKTT